jgi:hypothetical protein
MDQLLAEPSVDLPPPDACAPPRLEWIAHPAREKPAAALAALAIITIAAFLAADQLGHAAAGIVAGIVLLTSLRRFFLPTRYNLDQSGVSATLISVRRLDWTRVRRISTDAHGVYFGPRSQHSRWDAFLGLHIAFGREREAVLDWLREFRPGCDVAKERA